MEHGEIVEVSTWSDFHDALFLKDWASDLERYRSSFVYRGLENASYDLSTSLNRQGKSYLEKHLLRNFIKYSKVDDESKTIWKWLAIAQHHGLPTRLMDWTYSPLVAAHFAVADYNKFDVDGMIWAVNYVDSQYCLPDRLQKRLKAEGSYIFTESMLAAEVQSLDQLQELEQHAFALFFEPPSMDERIVNQYAVFSMMSEPDVLISDWLKDKQIDWFRIRVPAKLKWVIRDRLDQANITERMLFPGLDGLATWLKRHYKDIRVQPKDEA